MTSLVPRPDTTPAAVVPAGRTAADLVVTDDAARLVAAGTSEHTRRAYRHDWGAFTTWCAEGGRTALPASAETLVSYVGHLAGAGLAPATISRALGCIQAAHRTAGQACDAKAARVALRGHARTTPRRKRKAAPVTVDVLRALVDTLDTATPTGIRDTALLLLGFALGARRSELVGLDLADVVEVPEGLLVTIRASKTDRRQDTPGREVAVAYGAHLQTCPVRTVRAWIAVLADHGRTAGPLFVRVNRHGVLGRAQSGAGSADGRLTGAAVADVVKRTAIRAGLDPAACWSGHSLRRGFASTAYATGASPVAIGRHGGWVDGSASLVGYIDSVDRWSAHPLSGAGL